MLARLPVRLAFLAATLAGALSAFAATPLPSFPGAEGFGATTPGGRGGRVIFVTNLNNSGSGSFRAACEASGPRIVLFQVAGTIALRGPIIVRNPYLTIAGQSAPGDGICLRDDYFGIQTHDVVVRYLRSRLGDVTAQEQDCLDLLNGAHDCIYDHCSATWSIDESLSTSGVDRNCTIQWCLIGESLNHSTHHKGEHGFGSLARANGPMSWHHNLWIHNNSRNPRLGDNYGRGPTFPTFDVRNNIIYDFGYTASGLTQGILKVNYVGNYLRPGPSSKAPKPITVGHPSQMTFFIRANVFEGHDDLTKDNTQFFTSLEDKGKREVTFVDTPFPAPRVTPAQVKDVLATVGASRPVRDAVDARLVHDVIAHSGHIINSQQEVGGWPVLKSGPVPVDSDHDGIPDDWEVARGLSPHDGSDAAKAAPSGYTYLEEYLNGLAVTGS